MRLELADPLPKLAPDARYEHAAAAYGPALDRLARAYEADPDQRRDLLQEIHLALWRSFDRFEDRCSLRTWVYRVAHNTAATHVIRRRRIAARLVSLEDLELLPAPRARDDRRASLASLLELIQGLKPLDRQVILSYLEGMDAAATAEITGLSPANVAVKVSRIKGILARRFKEGGSHA